MAIPSMNGAMTLRLLMNETPAHTQEAQEEAQKGIGYGDERQH